jgi:cytochrome oxidase Cu insertion factor (SCO1/SenC/PrrC family)
MEGPRNQLLDFGFLTCRDADELTGTEFWKQKWQRQTKPGTDRFDVIAIKPDPQASREQVLKNFNPIKPWAYLDAAGWHERGRMGWFGMGSDTPESNAKLADDFETWIRSDDHRDWVVVVDCHI